MNRSDSITKLAPALVKAQSAMTSVTKDAKNPFFKSNYATLNAVREVALLALNGSGLYVLQPTVYVDGKAFIETIIGHESGEFISGLTEIIVKNASDAQQAGSGMSYARRYGLMAILCMAADDDDGNLSTGKVTSNVITAIASNGNPTVPTATSNKVSSFSNKKSKVEDL